MIPHRGTEVNRAIENNLEKKITLGYTTYMMLRARELYGGTQEEFAKELCIPKSTLMKWEQGGVHGRRTTASARVVAALILADTAMFRLLLERAKAEGHLP